MALAPDRAAIKALEDALAAVLAAAGSNPPQAVVRRIREGLATHADAVEAARSSTDPVRMPRATFDPADPKAIFQRSGSPRVFLWLPPATLEIAPYPSVDAGSLADPMFVSVVVQPTAAAATYPDDIQREFDHCIADGAVARVCGVEGAAWSSPRLALKHGQIFYPSKMNAKGKALRAHMPRGLRVQPVRFA